MYLNLDCYTKFPKMETAEVRADTFSELFAKVRWFAAMHPTTFCVYVRNDANKDVAKVWFVDRDAPVVQSC